MRVTLNERLGMVLENLHEGKSYSYLGNKVYFEIPKQQYFVCILCMCKLSFKIDKNKSFKRQKMPAKVN